MRTEDSLLPLMQKYSRDYASRLHFVALASFSLMLLSLFVLGSSPQAADLLVSPADKIAHLFVYFVMTLLLWIGLPRVAAWQAGLMVALVGCIDEVNQIWLPGRHPGIDDLGADLLGIILAIIFISLILSRRFSR